MSLSQGMLITLVFDLLTSFDTINDDTLLTCLSTRFGFTGTVLKWFTIYLLHPLQSVKIESVTSDCFELNFSGPQSFPVVPPVQPL